MNVDDTFVAKVEDELGMGAGAWDMIGAEKVCRAVIKVAQAESSTQVSELRRAANVLIDYCEAHDWGLMPEPFDSINPLLKLLGRAVLSKGKE